MGEYLRTGSYGMPGIWDEFSPSQNPQFDLTLALDLNSHYLPEHFPDDFPNGFPDGHANTKTSSSEEGRSHRHLRAGQPAA